MERGLHRVPTAFPNIFLGQLGYIHIYLKKKKQYHSVFNFRSKYIVTL
jgi:hypothetical protein